MGSGEKRLKREAYFSPYLIPLLRSRDTPSLSRNLHGVYKDISTSPLFINIPINKI
jgi:hypothetical protein